jgi:hypothetical protein
MTISPLLCVHAEWTGLLRTATASVVESRRVADPQPFHRLGGTSRPQLELLTADL